MTIQEMKRRKRELGYSNAKVAELSGVPLGTVQKIFSGETSYPRYATLQALEQVLGEPSSTTGKCFVNETTAPYLTKKQGDYTLKDYYAFPEDYRIELIDGVIYNMTSPASAHQLIAGYIYNQLFNHITGKHGDCLPMISPIDVQLDCDNKTMVEPDVIVVCDRNKVIKRCVYGAPGFRPGSSLPFHQEEGHDRQAEQVHECRCTGILDDRPGQEGRLHLRFRARGLSAHLRLRR